jgi:hypothetical protein
LYLATDRPGEAVTVLERYVEVVESIGGTPRTRVLERLEAVRAGDEQRSEPASIGGQDPVRR